MPLSPKSNNTVDLLPNDSHGNQLFPAFIKLNELRTLLVGAGKVGLEKITAIVNNCKEAQVTVVAKDVHPDFYELARVNDGITIKQKDFSADDLEEVDIVFAATNDNLFNAQLKDLAHTKGLLINVADKPDLCDFYLGAVVQKGDLKIAISTNGKSPTIAKRLKEILNEGIPNELDQTLQNMSALRQNLNGDFASKVKKTQ